MEHSEDQIKADAAAVAKGICPECGADLSKHPHAAIQGHADMEFPHGADPGMANTDHARRYRLLCKLAQGAKDAERENAR